MTEITAKYELTKSEEDRLSKDIEKSEKDGMKYLIFFEDKTYKFLKDLLGEKIDRRFLNTYNLFLCNHKARHIVQDIKERLIDLEEERDFT